MLGAIDEGFKNEESSSGSDNEKRSKPYLPADTNSQMSRSSRALEEDKNDIENPYLNYDGNQNNDSPVKSKTLLNNDNKKKRPSA